MGICPRSEAARPFRHEGARAGGDAELLELALAAGRDGVFMPGLGALVAGLGALGAIDFLAAAGVDVPRVAVRDSDGAEGAADAAAGAEGASGIGGGSAIAARRGINGSLRSLATSFTKSGRTSPLFPCKWSMPAVESSFKSTSGSTLMMMAPAFWAARTIDRGPPVVN